MASIDIKNVHKTFGLLKIIKDVSIEVPEGAFVVLVGPSGCGKSTLLRMIAGLEDINAGTISIGGRVINEVEPKHRDIAMVFQNYALYPHMTVAQNMGFSLRLARRPRAEIEARVRDAARILGLSDLQERYAKQLSGGQRQRVAMGRAIVRNPQVFLFDEPLSNLDAKLRVQMRAELKEIHASLKTTTIYVTHDQIEAMTMGDKIVVMRDGMVEQAAAPLELYDHPVNMFVAGFIGSPAMNFLTASVSADGKKVLLADGAELPLAKQLETKGEVRCGLRPELLLLAPEGTGFEMVVRNVEPTGSDTLIQGEAGGEKITAFLHQRLLVKPGEKLRLTILSENIHLFDTHSEMRIN